MSTVDRLYREEILDHYQDPRNFGKLPHYDAHSRQTNPLCGDDISIWTKFNNGAIGEIGFEGKGCAICLASASMLTDYAKGRSKVELTNFSEQDMLEVLGIEVSETRKKCAFLALSVLKDCLYAVQNKS